MTNWKWIVTHTANLMHENNSTVVFFMGRLMLIFNEALHVFGIKRSFDHRHEDNNAKSSLLANCKLGKCLHIHFLFLFYFNSTRWCSSTHDVKTQCSALLSCISRFMIQTSPQVFPKTLYTSTVRQVIVFVCFFQNIAHQHFDKCMINK